MPNEDKGGKKRKATDAGSSAKKAKTAVAPPLPPTPPPAAVAAAKVEAVPRPVVNKAAWAKHGKPRVVFVLESAGIAITDLGRRKNQVLCHDKDVNFLDAKQQKTWLFRPDIVHQVLLAVFDMPLCKEGHVKVYLNTIKNKAIEVDSNTRIPRTFKRFCGLISQLIDQGKVVNPETDQSLFQVMKYPIRQNVPEKGPVYGLCCSDRIDPVNAHKFVASLPAPSKPSDPTAYIVIPCRDNSVWPDAEEGYGDYVPEQNKITITQYEVCRQTPPPPHAHVHPTHTHPPTQTSPVTLIHKISNAFERHWQV